MFEVVGLPNSIKELLDVFIGMFFILLIVSPFARFCAQGLKKLVCSWAYHRALKIHREDTKVQQFISK